MSSLKGSVAKINSSKFEFHVLTLLSDYQDDLLKAVEIAINETAVDVVDELKQAGTFKGKKYRNSWTFRNASTGLKIGVTVYNNKHYRLTHLLEFGHAKQNGGRTREFPHIAPVNDKVDTIFSQKMESLLGKGWVNL